MGSDHFPIEIEIYGFNFFKEEFKKKVQVFKMDWEKFSCILDKKLEKYKEYNFEQVFNSYEEFIEEIYSSIKEAGGKVTTTNKENSGKSSPACLWWDETCSELVDTRREALKNYRDNPNPESLKSFTRACNQVGKKLKKK